jgi:hypothetical protein
LTDVAEGLRLSDLISDSYRRLNRKMHEQIPGYGMSGAKNAENVLDICRGLGLKTVLDYGCGKRALESAIGGQVEILNYDPAIPGLETAQPAGLVVCADVMEHVEPDKVDAVLDHIFTLALSAAYFVISTTQGTRLLPDGTPAHRSVHEAAWWRKKLERYGQVTKLSPVHAVNPECVFMVIPHD